MLPTIPGNHHARNLLASLVGTPPPSVYVQGPPGVFLDDIAREYASRLLCKPDEALQRCYSRLCAGNQYDYEEIHPEGVNGYKVDQIREALKWCSYAPASAPYRVLTIFDAHLLNTTSYSALLKPLEEAGDWIRYVLVGDQKLDLPVTVRGRCQSVSLGTLTSEEMAAAYPDKDLMDLYLSRGLPQYLALFEEHRSLVDACLEVFSKLDSIADWRLLYFSSLHGEKEPFFFFCQSVLMALVEAYCGLEVPVPASLRDAALRYGPSVFDLVRTWRLLLRRMHTSIQVEHHLKSCFLELKGLV